MIPDEQPQAAPQTTDSSPAKGRRRSRRGGRRHSKRRAPGSAETAPAARHNAEAEPPATTTDEAAAQNLQSDEATEAPVAAPVRERAAQPHVPKAKHPGVSQAIDQVTKVIEELKAAVNEMEEVLETLELAERQKIDDEREIESLQRALRHLHRPSHSSGAGARQ